MTRNLIKSPWTFALSLIISVFLLSTLLLATDNSDNPANVDVSKLQQIRERHTEMAIKKEMDALKLSERVQLREQPRHRQQHKEPRGITIDNISNPFGMVGSQVASRALVETSSLVTGSGRLNRTNCDSAYFTFGTGEVSNNTDTLTSDRTIDIMFFENNGSYMIGTPYYYDPGGCPRISSSPSQLHLLSSDSTIATIDTCAWFYVNKPGWDEENHNGDNPSYFDVGNVFEIYCRTTLSYAVMEITAVTADSTWIEFDYKFQPDGSTSFVDEPDPAGIDVLVNGADADTVEQGGEAVITIIFSEGQSTAEVSMWVDMDGDGALDPAVDWQIDDSELIADGDMEDEDGLVNGEYVITFGGPDDDEGPMRVANLNLLLQAVDAGGSDVGSLYIDPIGSAYSVSGSVSPVYANIIIGGWLSDTEDADSWMTVTDTSGNYQLMLPDYGTYDIGAFDFINVTDGMYADTMYKDLLVDGNLADPYNFTFLEPTSAVEGYVYEYSADPTRFAPVPVPGVDVWAEKTDEYCEHGEGGDKSATTDEYGYYIIGLNEGQHRVGLDGDDLIPDYLVPHDQCLYIADMDTAVMNFDVLVTDNTISGTVYMGDGYGSYAPYGGILVGAWSEAGWTEAETDEYGNYELRVSSLLDEYCGYSIDIWDRDELPPGTVILNHPWCVPSDSAGVDIYMEVYPGGVEGYITNAVTGDTLTWHDNVWIDVWNDYDFHAGTGPDEDGYFFLPLPPGNYAINAGGEGYWFTEPQPLIVTDQMIWMDFALSPEVSGVEGYIYDNDGYPITDMAWVDIWNNDYWMSTGVNQDGYYHMGIPNGTYKIQAMAEGFYPSEIDSITILDDFIWRDFYLDPASLDGTISGTVYDEVLRSGIPDVEVYLGSEFYGDMTYTDEYGNYHFNVPYGVYNMYVTKEGYSDDWADNLIVNSQTPDLYHDFYIRSISLDAVIRGQVLDRETQTPVGGSEVNAWNWYFHDYTYTGPDGYFMIDVPADTIWMDAWAHGYYWSETYMFVTHPGDTLDVFIEIDKLQSGPPHLFMVKDVFPDQGGWVELGWEPGQPDDGWHLTGYSIWRMNDWGMPAYTGITVPPRGMDQYFAFAPTKNDSSAMTEMNHSYWNEFLVTAHYLTDWGTMIYDDSNWMGGYSIDNLFPGIPFNPVANFVNDGAAVDLAWDPVTDEDLEYYSVYRGEVSGFTPTEPFAFTTDTKFFDDGIVSGTSYYYLLTATDQNGNESDFSVEVEASAVGIGDENMIPDSYALAQNYPNPFNPSTTIEFALPEAGLVTVKVYNLLGEEVATLVNDSREAGIHSVTWNAGQQASGVYLLQMRSGTYSQTRKLMLMK